MVQLDAAQTENLSTALVVARAWAVASGNDPTAVAERAAFAAWTESRGYIYANDGRNTSKSPNVTPEIAAILRQSLNLPHDKTGSNGRSTGMYQQISENVGGGWGDMAGTMDPAISTARFLSRLIVSGNPVYAGTLITPTGTRRVAIILSDPIAADVLRVQQPLADEAESSNYDASQVQIAREIVAQLSPPGAGLGWLTALEWITNMAMSADQQKQLDDYAEKVAALAADKVLADPNIKDRVFHGWDQPDSFQVINAKLDAIMNEIAPQASQVDGDTYGGMSYLVSVDRKMSELAAKVDALGTALDSKK